MTLIPTPTPTATPKPCDGDCNSDRQVTVDEILTMVNIALGNADGSSCWAGDADHDGQVTIDEILTAVNHAINGCGSNDYLNKSSTPRANPSRLQTDRIYGRRAVPANRALR